LVAVVVDVHEQRLRRAVEHVQPGGVGDVRERAIAVVAEGPVWKAGWLRDIKIVETVAVRVAGRDAVMPHAAWHERRVETADPLVEPSHQLRVECPHSPERGRCRLAEDRYRRSALN